MSDAASIVAFLMGCALIHVGGVFYGQGVISDDCDNYGKTEISGIWYECREIKGGD